MSEHPFVAQAPRRIVLTGGPGAGKTAVLEMVRRNLCRHVEVLPESASVVFRGGFPRRTGEEARKAAQRAIFHVQRELENVVRDRHDLALLLCDRGTIDGVAYWPGAPSTFWSELGTSLEEELSRYDMVIHMRTPPLENGYHLDPIRIEPAAVAQEIDARLLDLWSGHPRRFVIDPTPDFLTKAAQAIEILRGQLPPNCQMERTRTTL